MRKLFLQHNEYYLDSNVSLRKINFQLIYKQNNKY